MNTLPRWKELIRFLQILPGFQQFTDASRIFAVGTLILLPLPAFADLFANPLASPIGGTCSFQCITGRPYTVFMADDFELSANSLLSSFTFDAIRTGPVDLNFSTSVDWGIYSYNPGYLNSLTPSPIGSLITSGTSLAQQNGIVAVANAEDAIKFAAPLPGVELAAGDYWLALHADVFGWDGGADDTALYLAYGLGNGIFAWNLFPSDGSGWTNPNPAPGGPSGMAFAVQGVSVPEPATGKLQFTFLMMVAMALYATQRSDKRRRISFGKPGERADGHHRSGSTKGPSKGVIAFSAASTCDTRRGAATGEVAVSKRLGGAIREETNW